MSDQVIGIFIGRVVIRDLFLLIAAVIFFSCTDKVDSGAARDEFVIPYELNQPEQFKLDDVLHEISGISRIEETDDLLAVNDERGELYRISPTGEIISHKTFHKGGDYEDLATVGHSVYVMKSNGNLYFIPDFTAKAIETETFKAKLRDGMEFESLTYDSAGQKLFLLVKDGDSRQGKAPAYVFDLKRREFHSEPEMLIDPKKISGMKIKGKSLRASAMARHPFTGDWYIVSSINRLLLVCGPEGDGKGYIHLSKNMLPQPEGICFAKNGDLFISSEGLSKPGRLLRFTYKPQPE